jgi:hypothetical protein
LKNLTELKKILKTGMTVRTHVTKENCMRQLETVSTVRTVTHVQSKCFAMDNSWLDYPKKEFIKFIGDNKFEVYKPTGELLATYELLV